MTLTWPNWSQVVIEVSIIALHVSFLTGLYVVKKYLIFLDFGTVNMRAGEGSWHLRLHYVGDHEFVELNNPRAIYWTKGELERVHIHSYHPSSGKLFNLLHRMRPNDTPSRSLDTLKRIAGAFSTFQELHAPPFRFRVSPPQESLRFNAEVAM